MKSYSMIGSDGIPTKTGFSNPRLYGTVPRVPGRYARDRKILTLPEAVHRMTGFPASRFSLKDRGIIREGAAADLVIYFHIAFTRPFTRITTPAMAVLAPPGFIQGAEPAQGHTGSAPVG